MGDSESESESEMSESMRKCACVGVCVPAKKRRQHAATNFDLQLYLLSLQE